MQTAKANFQFFLATEVESITDEFLKKYIINVRDIEDEEFEEIKNFFSLIIKYICTSQIDKAVIICKELIHNNIGLGIPYVMLTHELINLIGLIMKKLLYKNAKNELYELYQLQAVFEDTIAKIYLDKYVKDLQKKNSLRISGLSDIYEQNIILYYKHAASHGCSYKKQPIWNLANRRACRKDEKYQGRLGESRYFVQNFTR